MINVEAIRAAMERNQAYRTTPHSRKGKGKKVDGLNPMLVAWAVSLPRSAFDKDTPGGWGEFLRALGVIINPNDCTNWAKRAEVKSQVLTPEFEKKLIEGALKAGGLELVKDKDGKVTYSESGEEPDTKDITALIYKQVA